MDPDPQVEAFKRHYQTALRANESRLPIVSSIGKQSTGKSYFLGRLFNDNDIPNKHGQCIKRGTDALYWKAYQDYLLFDMEGLEGDQGSIERDILNFSATFAITDILLLQIPQGELENSVYLDNFSYAFWHSSKISSKFNLDMPDIILLIKDPRISEEDRETIEFYNKIVKEFESSVNEKVKDLEISFINSIERVLRESKKSSKEEKKMAEDQIKKLKEEINIPEFKIYKHFCVYYQKGFGRNRDLYYQMKDTMQGIQIEESNFEELMDLITSCLISRAGTHESALDFKRENFLDFEGTPSFLIHNELCSSSRVSREAIFQNILIEIKYNVFSHFRNIDGYLRFMEPFNKYLVKFEKVNNEISKEIKNVTEAKLNETIRKLKQKHYEKLEEIIKKEFQEDNLRRFVMPYLKYLSAINFCDTFRLNQGLPDSFSYQTLSTFINFYSQENAEHQLNQMKKNLDMYKCLAYFDEEFEFMISTMLNCKFNLYQTMFSIYKKRIIDFLGVEYCYKEDLQAESEAIETEDYFQYIERLLILLNQINRFPISQLREFLSNIKNLYKIKILQKLERLDSRPPEVKIKRQTLSHKIYSFTLYERLIPSLFGILIGLTTTVIRSIIIAAAVDAAAATAAAAGLLWLPIVGWVIFGVTLIASIGFVIYAATNTIKKETVKFEFRPEKDFAISTYTIAKTQLNGELKEEEICRTSDKFKYKAEFSADTTKPKSAFLKIEFVINYASKSYIEYIEQEKKKLKDIYPTFNEEIKRNRK